MVIKFDSPTKNEKGVLNNTGSSAGYINYLGKEDELNREQWFSHELSEVEPAEVRYNIDRDHQGIGKNEGKFATGSINPTLEEWQALGKTDEERLRNFKTWISKEFTFELAGNFRKKDSKGNDINITPENINIYYKIEHDRHYTGMDEEVRRGERQQGEVKDGFNLHCHFVVARKTQDGKYRISPTTNNRKEFDRNELINRTERSFDRYTGYQRPIDKTYEYCKTMKNGNLQERERMIDGKINQQINQQKPIQEQEKQEHRQQPQQSQEHEQKKQHDRNKDFGIEL